MLWDGALDQKQQMLLKRRVPLLGLWMGTR
jgi:hypothetical protein